jgi:hypothetical protein
MIAGLRAEIRNWDLASTKRKNYILLGEIAHDFVANNASINEQ